MDLVEIAKTFGAWAAGAFAAGWLAWFLLKEYIKSRDLAQSQMIGELKDRIGALETASREATAKYEQALVYQRDELAAIARAGHNRERILVEMYRQAYQPHPAPFSDPGTSRVPEPQDIRTEDILQQPGHQSRHQNRDR